jgi:pyruvyltransferase
MIQAYWWKEVPNFGDALAPLLLERFANIEVEWNTISRSSIISIGSVLEHIPPLWDGYILGSGRLIDSSRLHLVQTRTGVSAKILAIRGPLSARGIPGSFALGDPGILANELVGDQDKLWDLGILPHWQDKELVERFKKLIPPKHSIRVIDPGWAPLDVLSTIGACRRIVTSSLHGMIVADAFGIPRRVEICPAMVHDGGTFKFQDYSASIKHKLQFGVMQTPEWCRVEDVKHAIYDAYKSLEGSCYDQFGEDNRLD